jgi:hypothetical protein
MSKMILTPQNIRLDAATYAAYEALYGRLGLTHHEFGAKAGQRLDANDTAFLTRQIEVVRAKVFEVKVGPLQARQFLPTATDIPAWASHVVEVIYDSTGRAKVVNGRTKDFPRVDVVASESAYKVVSLGAMYGWDLLALRQAIGTGIPLTERKGVTARRVVDAGIDEVLATGKLASVDQDAFGMIGFVNASAVTIAASAAGSWATALTTDAGKASVILDINNGIANIRQTTLDVFNCTDVLLAPAKYDLLATTPRSATSDETMLSFLQRVNPGVTFSRWHRLTAAGAGGKDRIVYYAKSAEVIEAIVPQEFEQLPPQVDGMETTVVCHARCGGVRIHQPKAIVYQDPTT